MYAKYNSMQQLMDVFASVKHSLLDNITYDFLKWLVFMGVFLIARWFFRLLRLQWKKLTPKQKKFMKEHMQWFSRMMERLEKRVK